MVYTDSEGGGMTETCYSYINGTEVLRWVKEYGSSGNIDKIRYYNNNGEYLEFGYDDEGNFGLLTELNPESISPSDVPDDKDIPAIKEEFANKEVGFHKDKNSAWLIILIVIGALLLSFWIESNFTMIFR